MATEQRMYQIKRHRSRHYSCSNLCQFIATVVRLNVHRLTIKYKTTTKRANNYDRTLERAHVTPRTSSNNNDRMYLQSHPNNSRKLLCRPLTK